MNTLTQSIIFGFVLAKILSLILVDTPLGKSFGPHLFSVSYAAFLFLGVNIHLIELFKV